MVYELSQSKKKVEGNYGEAKEIMFPPLQNRSSADLVIIRAYMSGRQVNMVYLDGRSSGKALAPRVRFTTQHNTRKNSYAMNGNCSVHHPHSYKIPYTLRNRHRPFPIQPKGTGRRAENNKRRITKGSKRHSQLCRCRRKDSATRTPEGVRRCLRMDHQAHNGSSKNNNNRRRSFKYRAQSKRAQILETSKAKEKEPDTRKKRSDSYPSRGSYKGQHFTRNIVSDVGLKPRRCEKSRWKMEALNPKKCSFGVEEGILSRHLITQQGIKANPSKVKAISDLQPLKSVSEIQNLNRKLAALNRFLLKGADKTLPFMRTLKSCTSGKMVQWTTEADETFRRMKELLKALLTGQETSHRVFWEHEVEFRGRNSVKGQILTDFLAETPSKEEEGVKDEEAKRKELEPESTWKLFTDGASSSDGSGAGSILVSPEGKEYTYALRFEFENTNNEAEYKALPAGLRIAKEIKVQELTIFINSQLVANQVKGLFEA
ncbi:reverse transcriptase domain-containing protein [Tanacetum coccineum]